MIETALLDLLVAGSEIEGASTRYQLWITAR